MAYLSERIKLNQSSIVARSFLNSLQWLAWFTALLGLTGIFTFLMMRKGPETSFAAWLVYIAGIVVILYKPRYGIYLVVCLGLIGDTILTPWFPFVKNFSSRESLLFVDDALIINPLETYLVLIFLSWFIHSISTHKLQIYRGVLFIPILAFLAFVLFGLGYGVFYTRGNLTIALWEARPLFYLAIMIFLVSNLLEKREHAINLVWAAMIGIFLEGVSGNIYFFSTLRGNLAGVNAITEHPAAVHMNTLIVFFLAAWLYKVSPTKRFALGIMLPVVLITYMATQRRAAFIAVAAALIIIAYLLYKENRRIFWTIIPIIIPLFAGYMLVFWNSHNALGLPAQAVKSVIAPSKVNIDDQSSNIYREIENINLNFTIHQKPLTGIGFGQKFYVIIPLPDISIFQWWQYFPHNSIIWIWLKTGVGGFFCMLFLIGTSLITGARALWRMPRNELSAVALTATLYVLMQYLFAYVDIGWDSQSMLYMGAMMGLINRLEYIVAQPVPLPAKRWRWQPDAEPLPKLLPLDTPASNTQNV